MAFMKEEYFGKVGTGLSAFGRFNSIIGAIVTLLIGIAFLVGGSYMIRNSLTESTVAVVQGMFCGTAASSSSSPAITPTAAGQTLCRYTVTYTVNGSGLSSTFEAAMFAYQPGETVTIYYDPKNPLRIDVTSNKNRIIGWIFIAVGIVLPLIAIATAVFAWKNKEAAGVMGAQDLMTSIFR